MSLSSIVIEITEKDSPKAAIHGIVCNLASVYDVHIIYPNYQNDEESMYAEWKHDRKLIVDAGKMVHIEAVLDAANFSPNYPVVIIPPYCELKLGAFVSIQKSTERAEKDDIYCAFVPKCTVSSNPFAGFTLIVYMLNWFFSLFYWRRKLVQNTDILVTFIIKKGKHQYFADRPNSAWLPQLYSGVMFRRILDKGAVLHNPPLQWLLKTHLHFGLGPWIFLYFGGYMAIMVTFLFFTRLGVYTLINAALIILFTFISTRNYVTNVSHAALCLLSPVYFLLFPFVLIHMKLN